MAETKKFNPSRLVRLGNVVVVTFNYRLNAFGFLAAKLSDTGDNEISGNYGIQDQITALQWVKRNIQQFGGDPSSITIYGQGSGATSTLALLVSPLAKGLFHKAVAVSGSAKIDTKLETAITLHRKTWINNTKCIEHVEDKEKLSDCLRELTQAEILNAIPDTWYDTSPPSRWGIPESPYIQPQTPLLIIDGKIIPYSLNDAMKNKAQNSLGSVDLVIGFTAEETDLLPADVLTGLNEKEFISYLERQFKPFNITKEEILSKYPLIDFFSPQQCYDQISSDIHIICPNLELVKGFSASDSIKGGYLFMIEQRSDHLCDYETKYCPLYSYHTYDLDVLSYNSENLGKGDIALGTTLLESISEFAETGSITAWSRFKFESGTRVNILNTQEPRVVENLKEVACAFWKQKKIDRFARIN
eukprot:TRINITY_DN7334_c0_g1_i2.p1 TRINITY_DN7334_c0_g1~~TRINITY_DN7334_c0_g1_i2.p1  ORF type:complete len:416 (+),score=66.97 TRINITY_DN7334_c0_g1_i2:406-1653(+)